MAVIYGTQGKKPLEWHAIVIRPTVFYARDAGIVPVGYGKVKIKGMLIYAGEVQFLSDAEVAQCNYLPLNIPSPTGCLAWYAICAGKVAISQLYINDKLCVDDEDYTGHFTFSNDGTAVYKPAGLLDKTGIALTDVSKISGVAHMFFDINHRLVTNADGKTPKVEYVVFKNLTSTGILYADMTEGSNPAAVIYELLTNKQWGLGFDSSYIDLTSFNYVASFFYNHATKKYGLNFIIDENSSIRKILDQIQEWCDVVVYAQNNKFYLRLMCDDSGVSPIGTLIDVDFKEFSFRKETWADVYNEFEGEYINPSMQYTKVRLSRKNESAFYMAGSISKMLKVDLTCFLDKTIANTRLDEIMQRYSFPKTYLNISVDRKYYDALPGDLINIINTEYGISGTFRITKIDLGTIDDLTINMDLEQASESLFDGNSVDVSAAAGENPEYVQPADYENLTFPSFTDTSTVKTTPFSDDATSEVWWGDDQENSGKLTYITDYTVTDHNKIVLTALWAETVQANYLGLLSVNCWQG